MMIKDNFKANIADAVTEYLERYGVDNPTTGAESPWQNNLPEGKNKIIEYVLDKVCMDFGKVINS